MSEETKILNKDYEGGLSDEIEDLITYHKSTIYYLNYKKLKPKQ